MSITCNLSQVLFVDIECVPQVPSFFDLDDDLKVLREKKGRGLLNMRNAADEQTSDELYDSRSGLSAEFGKIIVISAGCFAKSVDGKRQLRVKSFYGDDEYTILQGFFEMLDSHYTKSSNCLCGHNIREFDIPYICKRATVHGLPIPAILDCNGKKPREVNHLDTLELRKYGSRNTFISLDLLCKVLNVPTPKTDITGEDVSRLYREEKDLERIKQYCERDVVAVAELLLKFMREQEKIEEVV